MVILFSGFRRKGFMHALEGLIAAIVLFFYFSSASLPPLQTNDWTYNSMKQAGTEYITSIEKSDASELIAQDSRVFSKITNSLFETSDISIMKGGVLPKDIIVGLLGNSGNSTIILGGNLEPKGWCNTAPRNWTTVSDAGCIVNASTVFGIPIQTILIDINDDSVYDAVYVDLNNNGINDPPFEGPFSAGGYVTIGGTNYHIKYIDSDDESIKFVNITSFDYFQNIQNITMNGRSTRFVYYVADMSGDISQYDVILITNPIDLTPYLSKLKNFLRSGKGIVEVVNITNGNYNSAQNDLFGLVNASYGILGNGNEVSLLDDSRSISEPLRLKDYFSGISIHVNMFPYLMPPYDVFGLPIPVSVRVGFLNLTSGDVSIAIARIGTSYDAFYLDSNRDYNFSNPPEDEVPHFVGESFNTNSHEYIIKAIDPNGYYVDLRPSLNASLTSFFNPLLIVPNEKSWAVAEQTNTYHENGMSLFESFNISFTNTPVLGNETTLLAGIHTYGRINVTEYYVTYFGGFPVLGDPATLPSGALGVHSYANATMPFFDREYNISVTDDAGTLKLNIDLNENLAYDNAGEGPYLNNSIFTAGSGKYTIFFDDLNYTNFTRISMVYNASITNISGSFFLNIDLNNDLRYDGLGEGPFADDDVLKIGPENYRVDIAPNGYSAKFTMYKREAVSAAIAGNKYTGRTVWMPDITKGKADSWNYLAAAMLWVSPKNEDVLKSSGYSNIVSSKKVFILNTDGVFQPYVVEFSRRYG